MIKHISLPTTLFFFLLISSLMITLSLMVVSSVIAHSEAVSANNRPNILVIIGDDFGFSDIGVFGSEISKPNLDQIAKEGKMLTNYYTHPVCSLARSIFLTGVDNHLAGIGTMFENIAPN